MPTLPYETEKYGWLWACYLIRMLALPAERPLTLTAATMAVATLRMRLFNGRRYLEHHDEFKRYQRLSSATRIKVQKDLAIIVHKLEDFVEASNEFRSYPLDALSSAVNAINTFAAAEELGLNVGNLGLNSEQVLALKDYTKAIRVIRIATISETIMILRK